MKIVVKGLTSDGTEAAQKPEFTIQYLDNCGDYFKWQLPPITLSEPS